MFTEVWNMVNGKQKLGTFSSKDKQNYTRSIFKGKTGKSALNPVSLKKGAFSSKTGRIQRQLGSTPGASTSPFDNLNKTLLSGSDINLKSLTSNTSTGVMGKKQVVKAQESFFNKISGTDFVDNVVKQGDKVLFKGNYQKGEYLLSPTSTKLKSKGWSLDIPDTFIREGNVFKAPTKQYEKSYDYYKRDGRKSERDYVYGSYTPTEVIINPDTNRVKQFVDRDISNDYEYYKSTDNKNIKQKEKSVFDKTSKEFYDTGLLKSSTGKTTFRTRVRDEENGDTDRLERYGGVRLAAERKYAEGGYLQDEKLYGDYESSMDEYKEYGRDGRSLENTRRQQYLRKQTSFAPDRSYSSVKTWTPKLMHKEDERMGNTREVEKDSEAKLATEEYFVGDQKVGEIKYDTYTDADVNRRSFDRDQFQKVATDYASNAGSYGSFYNVLKPGAQERKKTEKSYGYGVREYSFFDPQTGKTTRERFW